MPYIKPELREDLEYGDRAPATPGELNFVITMELLNYVDGRMGYQAINDVLGAIEGAKLEFYRRVVAPYEDRKIAQNGDVY